MNWQTRVRTALSSAAAAPDDDVIAELAQHARAVYEAALATGLSHDEADAQVRALIERWRAEAPDLRRRARQASIPPPASFRIGAGGLVDDIRFALRLLARQPRAAALTIATMALGIGATTTLFSMAHGVLFKPLPWPDAEHVVVVKETRGGRPPRFNTVTNAAYIAWADAASSALEGLAAWSTATVTLADGADPERIRVANASASLFAVLRIRPLAGSFYDDRSETGIEGGPLVISEGLWRTRYGANPAALGRVVQLDGRRYRVAGVMPDAAGFPDAEIQAWVPFRVRPASDGSLSLFNALARLKPGTTPAQAAAEGTARGRFVPETGMTTTAIFGSTGAVEISATPLRTAISGEVRYPLIVLLVAVSLLLVTATVNVAGVQLARATAREREMAIRAALGAAAGRVVRQLLVENLVIGLAGGAVGLALAWWAHRALPLVLPADFPRREALGLEWTALAVAFAISIAAALACGLAPALRVRRVQLVDSLAGGAARLRRRAGGAGLRTGILSAEVAIASVLLVGGSLLGRSFAAQLSEPRGYEPTGVLIGRLALTAPGFAPERRFTLVASVLDRLRTTAGITAAGFTSELPLGPGGSTSAFTMRGSGGESRSVQASPRIVSEDYIAAVGLHLTAGRSFGDADTDTAPPVAIVNRAFALRYLQDDAVGAVVPFGAGYGSGWPDATIVGVVDDVRYVGRGEATQPELYFPYRQFRQRLPVSVVTLVVKAQGPPASLAPLVRAAVRNVDPTVVPEGIATLESRILTGLARPRLYAVVLGGFAGLAVLVAAVGLFGLLSQWVGERSSELAMRTALGARRLDTVRLVLGQGMRLTAVGLGAGLALSLAAMRLLSTLLYGVSASDAFTYIAAAALVFLVAAAACVVPVRRASRIDPAHTLRV